MYTVEYVWDVWPNLSMLYRIHDVNAHLAISCTVYWPIHRCCFTSSSNFFSTFFLNIVLRCLGWGWFTSMVELLVLMVVLLSTLLYSIFLSPADLPMFLHL